MKRYHTFTLTLGIDAAEASALSSPGGESRAAHGNDGIYETPTYALQRIGTAQEKQSVERELAELQERLRKVEGWKKRREEIESELGIVRMEGGEVLPPPAYAEIERTEDSPEQERQEEGVSQTDGRHEVTVET